MMRFAAAAVARMQKSENVGMWKDLLLHRQELLHHRVQFGVTW
jgi:hypothetical protein